MPTPRCYWREWEERKMWQKQKKSWKLCSAETLHTTVGRDCGKQNSSHVEFTSSSTAPIIVPDAALLIGQNCEHHSKFQKSAISSLQKATFNKFKTTMICIGMVTLWEIVPRTFKVLLRIITRELGLVDTSLLWVKQIILIKESFFPFFLISDHLFRKFQAYIRTLWAYIRKFSIPNACQHFHWHPSILR